MKALTFILLFFSLSLTMAQAPLVKLWDKKYGGGSTDQFKDIRQTKDGGYILGGLSFSATGIDKTVPLKVTNGGDYWIVKLDSSGIKQWDKDFGGTLYSYFKCLEQTTNGGYIIGGYTQSGVGGDKTQPSEGGSDYWIVKTDSAGNKEWEKGFGGSGNDYLYWLQQTNDGGYMLAGTSNSGISGQKTELNWDTTNLSYDYWIIKIDTGGNIQWQKTFGGFADDDLQCLQQTSDAGYILGGFSKSGASGNKTDANRDTSNATSDFWIIKIDSIGTLLWDKTYGGYDNDELFSLRQTSDGGYIMGGTSYSAIGGDKTQDQWGFGDYWIVKVDATGYKQWDKNYGGASPEEFFRVFQTSDGGFMLSGDSYSQATGNKSENNLGIELIWVVKTNSLGVKEWDKTISTKGHDENGLCIQGPGYYVFASEAEPYIGGYKTIGSQSRDYWIVKFADTSFRCSLNAILTASQTTFCSDDSARVCAPSGYASYLWNMGQTDSCIKATLAGNYYVTVTDNSGCTAESNHLSITVHPSPPVSISVNGDTLAVYNAVTQQWYLNGSTLNGATTPIYIATQGGSYTVQVTDSNGCTATSNPVIISGVDNLSEEDVVSVYPNPSADGSWQLQVGNNFMGGMAEVFDANGRVVFTSVIGHPSSVISPGVAKGVYLLRISSAKSSVTRKLVRL